MSAVKSPGTKAVAPVTKAALIAGICLLLLAEAFCGFKVHTLSNNQEKVKKDYATVNSIAFGMLSVDEWRDKVAAIAKRRIQNFRLTPEQQAELQKELEQVMNSLIDKALQMINKPQKSLGGKLKKMAVKTFVNEDQLRAQVPAFAKKIVQEVNTPESMHRLSSIAQSKLNQVEQTTYDSTKTARDTVYGAIFARYHVSTQDEFNRKSETLLNNYRTQTYGYSFGTLGAILVILAIWWLVRKRREMLTPLYILSIVSAAILLIVGLTTTMIEVDARIGKLYFHLLGETVNFNNQVLFFQSKSILDVVMTLVTTGKYDSIIVGVLILTFSILFPITKLISTGIHLLGHEKWKNNKIISYFAFKSGKWSMADVMVVAILMTYIGFNGIIQSQLKSLNVHNDTLTSITTNNTALQPGYIVFTAFVLYGLILAQILKWVTRHKEA